jgi:hypothetical protein
MRETPEIDREEILNPEFASPALVLQMVFWEI